MKQDKASRIIVLGGSGETGKRIVNYLSASYPQISIASAARRPQENVSKKNNVTVEQLDIDEQEQAIEILKKYDLAIIALGPMERYGNKPHQLCLKAGIDAIDINDSLVAADKILSLHEHAIAAERQVFTGMGFAPGLSTLLLTQLAREKASSTGNYHCRLYMGAAYGGGETSPYAVLASFSKKLDCFRDNQRVQCDTPWQDEHAKFQFPAQKKAVDLIPFATPEVAGLASGRLPDDLMIASLDSRYHIQYLSQGFARLLAKFNFGESMINRLAKKFFSGGQSMKNKKDADPDTTLWVYPEDAMEQGLMVHGVISSYDLTALMACSVTDCWLNDKLQSYQGVFAVEHLEQQTCKDLHSALTTRGVTIRRSSKENYEEADVNFGWSDTPVSKVSKLRNYGENWYSFECAHPKMAALQQRFLFDSDIWKSLKQKLHFLSFTSFVITTMFRWKSHNKRLAAYREKDGELTMTRWRAITKDMSMFTSGYSRAREILGKEVAFKQYRKMFLETGRMEMRWLWPKPEVFAAFSDPAQSIIDYWSAFMRNYASLGLFDVKLDDSDSSVLVCDIKRCAYAKMFFELGCGELASLVREMEQEALAFICSQSGLQLEWQHKEKGEARVILRKGVYMKKAC